MAKFKNPYVAFQRIKLARAGLSNGSLAQSSSSVKLAKGFSKTLAESAVKNRAGHLRELGKFTGQRPLVTEVLLGIAKQMGYEAVFEYTLDIIIDSSVAIAELDDPSLDNIWELIKRSGKPTDFLARLSDGFDAAADVTAVDGIVYVGVLVSVLAERRRRGKAIAEADLGDLKIRIRNGKPTVMVDQKEVSLISSMAKDPVTHAYLIIGAIGTYEGRTGKEILPKGDLDLDAGFFESSTAYFDGLRKDIEKVGNDTGLAYPTANPLTGRAGNVAGAAASVAGTMDKVRKVGNIVGQLSNGGLSALSNSSTASRDPDLLDAYDSRLKKIAERWDNKSVRSIF